MMNRLGLSTQSEDGTLLPGTVGIFVGNEEATILGIVIFSYD